MDAVCGWLPLARLPQLRLSEARSQRKAAQAETPPPPGLVLPIAEDYFLASNFGALHGRAEIWQRWNVCPSVSPTDERLHS